MLLAEAGGKFSPFDERFPDLARISNCLSTALGLSVQCAFGVKTDFILFHSILNDCASQCLTVALSCAFPLTLPYLQAVELKNAATSIAFCFVLSRSL